MYTKPNRQQINNEIDEFTETGGYVIINMLYDNIRLSYSNKCNETECLFCNTPRHWEKKDIVEIISAFNIQKLNLPKSNARIDCFELYTPRELEYNKALNQVQSFYTKKYIFLIRKTSQAVFLNMLRKQKFVVLANIDSDKEITLKLFEDINCKNDKKYIPLFSDSDMLRAYLDEKKKDSEFSIKDYKPLIMSFRDITHRNKKDNNLDLIINPVSYPIQGKDFSFTLSPELVSYIYDVIAPKLKELALSKAKRQ